MHYVNIHWRKNIARNVWMSVLGLWITTVVQPGLAEDQTVHIQDVQPPNQNEHDATISSRSPQNGVVTIEQFHEEVKNAIPYPKPEGHYRIRQY